jgi:hypothetical protein
MSVNATAPQNALAPYQFQMVLSPNVIGTPVDLTTITAATLSVRRADASKTTWTAALSNQTSTTLTLTHPYLPGDVALLGLYQVYAVLTTASGPIDSTSVQLTVYDPFVG